MLAYFPVPYPDELLYSVIARYGIHSGLFDNQKAINRDVFSNSAAIAVPDLPGHLDILAENLKTVWKTDAQYLAHNLTQAPFYLPFLDFNKAKLVSEAMGSGLGEGVHTRCGLAASSISQPEYFRFCPQCFENQINVYGEPYWRRIHQLPGVELCAEHHCRLINTAFSLHPKNKHEYVPAIAIADKTATDKFDCNEAECRVYELIQQILFLKTTKSFSYAQWTQLYQGLAERLNMKKGSRVEHHKIAELLTKAFSNTSFEALLNLGTTRDWLVCLFSKHRKSFHPIRHMMAFAALMPESDIESIFNMVDDYSKELPAADKNTSTSNVSRPELRQKRLDWLRLNKKYHYPGVKKLRKSLSGGALYSWLYRHDRDWLLRSLPKKSAKTTCQLKVDYNQWDFNVLSELKCYQAIALKKIDRQRLSQNHLLRNVSRHNSVVKHLSELPKTKEWLEANAESVEDYQIFRLTIARETLRKKRKPVKRWRLLREGRVRKELITPKIEDFLSRVEQEEVTG